MKVWHILEWYIFAFYDVGIEKVVLLISSLIQSIPLPLSSQTELCRPSSTSCMHALGTWKCRMMGVHCQPIYCIKNGLCWIPKQVQRSCLIAETIPRSIRLSASFRITRITNMALPQGLTNGLPTVTLGTYAEINGRRSCRFNPCRICIRISKSLGVQKLEVTRGIRRPSIVLRS